jgi:hypothetical protein
VLGGFTPFQPVFAALRRHVLSTPDGRLCASLVSRHFSEARGLVRGNRRVAVAWHRANGPAFVGTLVRAFMASDAAHPDQSFPPVPEGLSRFLAALGRYGSAGLRADVERHGPAFTALIHRALAAIQSRVAVA